MPYPFSYQARFFAVQPFMPMKKAVTVRLFLMLLITIQIAGSACGRGSAGNMPLTSKAVKRDFVSSVMAEGVVESHSKHTLTNPRIMGAPWLVISFLAPEGEWVNKGDVVVEYENEWLLEIRDKAVESRMNIQAEISQIESEHSAKVAQLKAEIKSASSSSEVARLKLASLEFVSPREKEISELKIERSLIQASKSSKKLESERALHSEVLNQKQLLVKQEETKIEQARTNIERLILKAPVDGYLLYEINMVVYVKYYQGARALWTLPVVNIPDISALQVKLQLSETDVQGVEKDQEVEIIIPSLGDLKLTGKVSSVAKVAKPVSRGSDVKAVETIVSIDSLHPGLVPGITARCTVCTQRVEQAVVVPLESVFTEDSAKVVYSLSGDSYRELEIKLGVKGEDFTVVDSGLAGGENLALRKPDEALIKR